MAPIRDLAHSESDLERRGRQRFCSSASNLERYRPRLRNQDLVSYFPHDEIQLDRWTREPASVDAFVERWLRGPTSSLPAEDLDRWRNALLHVGSSQVPSSEEKDRILGLLSTELERRSLDSHQGASPAERLEAALFALL